MIYLHNLVSCLQFSFYPKNKNIYSSIYSPSMVNVDAYIKPIQWSKVYPAFHYLCPEYLSEAISLENPYFPRPSTSHQTELYALHRMDSSVCLYCSSPVSLEWLTSPDDADLPLQIQSAYQFCCICPEPTWYIGPVQHFVCCISCISTLQCIHFPIIICIYINLCQFTTGGRINSVSLELLVQ